MALSCGDLGGSAPIFLEGPEARPLTLNHSWAEPDLRARGVDVSSLWPDAPGQADPQGLTRNDFHLAIRAGETFKRCLIPGCTLCNFPWRVESKRDSVGLKSSAAGLGDAGSAGGRATGDGQAQVLCGFHLDEVAPVRQRNVEFDEIFAYGILRTRQMYVDRGDQSLHPQSPSPIRTQPPPPWPYYSPDEIACASAVLESGLVNQWSGPWVSEFERKFARLHGEDRDAVAVANGSVALECALRALGIGPGDEVIVASRSFIASAACVLLVGATPVFSDIDFHTQLITPTTIAPLITERTRAILPVHLHGRPCDMVGIMDLAAHRNLFVVEDCAQSLGARIGGRRLGTFGHAATFSFCQDKIVTTAGEGGMVLFADKDAWHHAWSFKDHGKSRDAAFARHSGRKFRWLHESIGTNWRMTEFQAAIGCCQLDKVNDWVAARNRNALRLVRALSQHACASFTPLPDGDLHAFYRLDFTIKPERLQAGWDRDRILAAVNNEGILMFEGPCPEIYRERSFSKIGSYPPLPNAAQLGAISLTMLTHPTIDDEYLAACEAVIAKVFSVASL